MDFTPRLGLNKPDGDPETGDYVDVDKLNENSDKIDSTISFTPCLSTARPAVPFQGQAIIETDTGKAYVWGGSGWLPLLIGGAPYDSRIGLGVNPSSQAARLIRTFGLGGGSVSQVMLQTSGTPVGHRALSVLGASDTNDRWWVDFDGSMQWGPGSSGGDISLKRSAPGTLDISTGKLTIGGVVPGNSVAQVFTNSGTWTKPAGAKRVWVRVQAGGGAGGGAIGGSGNACGGGGGGGGYCESMFDAGDLGSTVAVGVGGGGVGVVGGSGGGGGNSTFGAFCTASGGNGGGVGANTTTSNTAGIGVGGDATGGNLLNIKGGSSTFGRILNNAHLFQTTAGGSCLGQGGATSGSTGGNGNGATGYGGGGGNAVAQSTSRAGGDGAPGIVIVITFF